MPTAFTGAALEKQMTLPQYLLRCARGMGACVSMRDEPLSKPIPEKFEDKVDNPHHREGLDKAQTELDALKALSDEEGMAFGIKTKKTKVKEAQEYLDKRIKEEEYYSNLADQVKDWTPPTGEHKGLKDFAAQQLSVTMSTTKYSEESLKSKKEKEPLEYLANAIESAQWGVDYHTKHLTKKEDNYEDANKWLKELRDNLKTL